MGATGNTAAPSAPDDPTTGPSRGRGRLRPALASLLVLLGVFAGGMWTGWLVAVDRDAAGPGPEIVTVARVPVAGRAVIADVRGLPIATARQALVDGGVDPTAITVTDQPSALTAGTVVAQDPVGGGTLTGGVALVAAAPATVPDVVGRPARGVVPELEATGARVIVEDRYAPAAPVGSVLAVTPPPGQPLPAEVTLAVASPPSSVYLDELDAVAGGCSGGELQIDGTTYAHALRCSARAERPSAEFLLDRGVGRIAGTVGIPDTDEPGPTARLVLVGDGRELLRTDLVYGRAVPIDVPTDGVLRLAIRVEGPAGERVTAALGDVILYGPREAVDGLTDG